MLAPKGSMEIHEEAWNAYPYCRTVITVSFSIISQNYMYVCKKLAKICGVFSCIYEILNGILNELCVY